MAIVDDRVLEEIEALQAILMDEVLVRNNESGAPDLVQVVVVPATADDTEQQYVRVTLEVKITDDYPNKAPQISLRNPRGLDDDQLKTIIQNAKDKCLASLGDPIIYDLIELIREHLTKCNLPACPCTICLYGFTDGDQFIKTPCYHYYHAHCLAELARNTEKYFKEEQEKLPQFQREKSFEVLCPVCREPIDCDVDTLSKASLPLAVQNAQVLEPDSKLRDLQAYMNALYLHQKEKGGIIDPEAADSKVLLVNEPYYVSKSWACLSQSMSMTGTSTNRLMNNGSDGYFDSQLVSDRPEPEPPAIPRWRQRQIEQQERQRQRVMQQQQRGGRGGGGGAHQPKPPKPPKPQCVNSDTDNSNQNQEQEVENEQPQHSSARHRRGRGRGNHRNHRNR